MDNSLNQINQSSRSASVGHSRKKINLKKFVKPLIGVVISVIVVVIGVYFYNSTTSSHIDSGKYQAVHLVNGMNYYGKLQPLNGGYMKLTNIFYVQLKSGVTEEEAISSLDLKNIELVKWGNEIQGPTDLMIINKDQIISFENLKDDGKVVQAIKKYLAEN